MVALGSAWMIYFPFLIPLLGSNSELEHAPNSKSFSATTSDYLAWHSFMLWVGPLWNSHHFFVSLFSFVMPFFDYVFEGLSRVTPYWFYPLFGSLEVLFPHFRFTNKKYFLFCLNICLIFTRYLCVVQGEDMTKNSISTWMYFYR